MKDKIKENIKYDLKTIKLKPETYSRLIQAKARLDYQNTTLHSFDELVDHLLSSYLDNLELRNKPPLDDKTLFI